MRVRHGVTAAVTGLALAACGGSGYHYVANPDEGAYFKVPEEWTLFDEADILEPREGLSPADAAALQSRLWLRGFDAAGEPSPENVFSEGSATPRGYAQVLTLTREERDSIDAVALRSSGFPTDPETMQPIDPVEYAEDQDGPIRLLELDETVVKPGGRHGARVTAYVEGDPPYVFSHTTLVDATTTRLYIFTVGCNVTCWEANQDLLLEIADSWTLEETS
jgi:hypothetical protein